MVSSVRVVTVCICDHDAAGAVPVGKLGFGMRRDESFGASYQWLDFSPPGTEATLLPASDFGQQDWHQLGKHPGIVVGPTTMVDSYRTLAERGVTFPQSPTYMPWGLWQFRFVDLDGNGFVLVSHESASIQ